MPKEKRFIGTFVNNVYGILMGFGFCNVVRDIFFGEGEGEQQIWLASQIAMSAFIIIVVCLYWWDWSENIESKAQSTFNEFTIDIMILFTLEFLFFLFENPKRLAILFLVLSILNFMWVLNFLWEKHKADTNSKGYLRNLGDMSYIIKKVHSIVIFSICLLVIYGVNFCFQQNYNIAYVISTGLLIMFFIFSRYIAYRQRPL